MTRQQERQVFGDESNKRPDRNELIHQLKVSNNMLKKLKKKNELLVDSIKNSGLQHNTRTILKEMPKELKIKLLNLATIHYNTTTKYVNKCFFRESKVLSDEHFSKERDVLHKAQGIRVFLMKFQQLRENEKTKIIQHAKGNFFEKINTNI